MTKRIMYVEGLNGQVELLSDRVVVHRKGFLNALSYGFNAKREIPLGAIAEVDFKDAGMLRFGEIDFVRAGHVAHGKKGSLTAVRFGKKSQEGFDQLKEKVFAMISQQQRQHI